MRLILNAGHRIRTCVGTKPTGPKPVPFDHSGNPAYQGESPDPVKNVSNIFIYYFEICYDFVAKFLNIDLFSLMACIGLSRLLH